MAKEVTYYIFHSNDSSVVHYGEIEQCQNVETGQLNKLFFDNKDQWMHKLENDFNIKIEDVI